MAGGHKLHPTILREYDIRGVVGDTLNAPDVSAIGRAFGSVAAERFGASPNVCVGYDGRLSSPELEAALVEGLTEAGSNVIRVGRGPTPLLYYSAHVLEADAGVMITGSHNPPEYNGIKMVLGGDSFFGDEIQALGARISDGRFASGQGAVQDQDMLARYVERIVSDHPPESAMRIAWDPGNGAAGEALLQLIELLPGEHFVINAEIDGTFPNHHPDPTVEKYLTQLKNLVADNACDIGIGFDGDGDRLGVIDARGRVLWGDQILLILARDILPRNAGAPIIADVKASQVFFDEVERAGGEPILWKAGHSLIRTKMKEIGAPLAGEMSGHIFFSDGYYGYDDALYAAVRLLGVLAVGGESLAQMRDALPVMFNTPEVRFDCPEERKFAVIEEVKQRVNAEAGVTVRDIDGVRVETGDGWWLLRASNTQAVLVARCESASQDGLDRLKAIVSDQLRQSGLQPPDFA
ncbi:MAG: phosphomannomutase/phosphoglucomutase [Rhodospirillales bacterium]|jgi:phosphomannomutase|nr:phosphomannomutase [Rhodospirillaceae bacterium]MDP6430393.1 phosphomannomutase/phosphoglucomutase [Rhodospirillales bacterium]MDP6646693.1 phosphomannomutase/phosphoglucomutase [Rhodospirillales bacterium]